MENIDETHSLSSSVCSYSGTYAEEVQPNILQDRGIQVITSAAVTTGIYSHGRGVGVIASIGIAVLFALVPMLYMFFAVYDRVRTQSEEMGKIKSDLAEKQLEALQQALPAVDLSDSRPYISRALGELSTRELQHEQGFSEEARKKLTEEIAVPLVLAGLWKEILKFEKKPELTALAEALPDNPHEALKVARNPNLSDDKDWKSRLAFIDQALHKIEADRENDFLTQNGFTEADYKLIVRLADGGLCVTDLESFLLKCGDFGKDPTSETFKKGMALVKYQIDKKKDDLLWSEVKAIQDAIINPPAEGLEKHLQKEVRVRLDRILKTNLYQLIVKYEDPDNQLLRFIQDLTVAVRLESRGIDSLKALGATYLCQAQNDRKVLGKGES